MKRKSALLGILAQCKWLLHCEPSSRPDSAPSLVSDKICCLHSSFFCDLDLCKDLCRMKRKSHRADSCQSWMCACLHKKKCWVTCATWKRADSFFSLSKYVLVNTNNIYYGNNTSPRKQHFSASLYLLGRELKRSNKDWGEHPVGGKYSAFCLFTGELRFTFENIRFISFCVFICHWKKVGEMG